jgi:hypothetical protein
MVTELVLCPNCHRGIDERWHYCAYCAYRLLNEDGSRRKKPTTGYPSETISGLMPQSPSEGPPFPKSFRIKWPWGKG